MKVLIIRLSSIGDIVLTSPVVRCIKLQSNAEIHFLTKLKFKCAIDSNVHIDEKVYYQDSFLSTLRMLRNNNYDLIIDLHKNLRSSLFKLFLGKRSVSYNKLMVKRYVRTTLPYIANKYFSADEHIADRYFTAVTSMGVINDRRGLEFYIDDGNKVSISHSKKLRIAYIVGTNYYTKTIPTSLWVSLTKELKGYEIHLIGGERERSVANQLAIYNKSIYNHVGQLNLQQSASIVHQCDLVVTGDTGMMHIAAAFEKPMLVIWGSTSRELGFYPYRKGIKVGTQHMSADLKCRPCSKSGRSECPKNHFNCMRIHKSDEALEKISSLIKSIKMKDK